MKREAGEHQRSDRCTRPVAPPRDALLIRPERRHYSAPVDLDTLKAKLAATPALRPTGRVLGVTGLALRVAVPGVRVGDLITVQRRGGPLECEVVGFGDDETIAMPLGHLTGVGPDDVIESTGGPLQVRASRALLGRVVEVSGVRSTDRPSRTASWYRSIRGLRPLPRRRSRHPSQRASASSTPHDLAEGALGLFAGSGVGKSTLLGAIARGASAEWSSSRWSASEGGRSASSWSTRAAPGGTRGRRRRDRRRTRVERLRAAQVATA